MKDITTFINESKKTPKREFLEYVNVWIDEMYQEGVVNYDDEHIKKYAEGKENPNYYEIVKGVMEEFKSKMSSELKSMLENFLKKDKQDKSEVIGIILTAIEQFAASNEFPGY